MRTTVTLDPDVAAKPRPYQLPLARDMGARSGVNLVKALQLAGELEDAELCSTDTDFVRFPGLRWTNPLA